MKRVLLGQFVEQAHFDAVTQAYIKQVRTISHIGSN